jgi:hypothetical protein
LSSEPQPDSTHHARFDLDQWWEQTTQAYLNGVIVEGTPGKKTF